MQCDDPNDTAAIASFVVINTKWWQTMREYQTTIFLILNNNRSHSFHQIYHIHTDNKTKKKKKRKTKSNAQNKTPVHADTSNKYSHSQQLHKSKTTQQK